MVDAAVDNLSDEIEYLYTTPRKQHSRKSPNDDTSVDCGFCGESLDHFTIEERQQHCNSHVDGDDGVSQSMVLEITGGGGIAKYLRNSNIGFSGKRDKPPKAAENVFWHPLSDSAPPRNFTPCLVPLLKRHLLALHSKNAPTSTSRAVLCSAGVTHIHYEKFDWLWGCGYRNFLMACTALITQTQQPLYFAMLDGDPEKPIGLRNIQRWIEDAWQDGYDAEGAQELDRCLYQTNKWIGTGELNVAFTYRGIPSRLVDFPRSKSSTDTADALIQWVVKYFSPTAPASASPHDSVHSQTSPSALDALKPTPVTISTRMPVILQHKGHSRTIIGYEIMKNGNTNLLVLDPARPIDQHTRKAALAHHNRTKQNAASISPSSMPSKSASTSAVAPTTHKKITTTVKSAVHSLSNRSPLKRVQEKLNGEKRQYIDVDADELDEASNNKRMRGGIKPRSSNEVIDVDIIDVDDVEEAPTTKATSASANIKGKGKDYGTPSFTKSIPQSPTTTKTAPPSDDLDHLKFVKMFRVDAKKLSKNNQYQLLWLPLSAPLTEAEKIQGKTVISEQIIV